DLVLEFGSRQWTHCLCFRVHNRQPDVVAIQHQQTSQSLVLPLRLEQRGLLNGIGVGVVVVIRVMTA
ncbi:hypothetical protein PENTCL1PPCAC_7973, partial [Pristionchus entomophagus]